MMAGATTAKMPKGLQQKIMREFRRPLFGEADRGFIGILLVCFILQAAAVIYLSGRPIPEYSQREIVRNQERYVKFIGLDVEPPARSEILTMTSEAGTAPGLDSESQGEGAAEEAGESESSETGGGESGGSGGGGTATREMSAENRQAARMASAGAMREAIAREVSDKGLLRLLTGTGSAVSGSGVSNPFTGSNGSRVGGDLDPILASSGGLKTQGESGLGGNGDGEGLGVRGQRTGSSTGIDDVVQNLEGVSSRSLSRKGALKIESTADVAGRGRKSIYRSPTAIYEVIFSHQSAIQYCYERELKRFPDLKGKVKVSITIGADGSVKSVSILESTISSERVERCIISRIRRWKDFKPIDADEGDVTVVQTFIFS